MARIPGILYLFSREFIFLLLISSLAAVPAAWYFLNQWLQNYAYRTRPDIVVFLASGGIAVVIALLSIACHALKAANTNPAVTLIYK